MVDGLRKHCSVSDNNACTFWSWATFRDSNIPFVLAMSGVEVIFWSVRLAGHDLFLFQAKMDQTSLDGDFDNINIRFFG